MQRRDKSALLRLVAALGEQLLELVDDQQQAPAGGALKLHFCGLPRGQREPLRVRRQTGADRGGVGPGQRGNPDGEFVERSSRRGEQQPWPGRRYGQPGESAPLNLRQETGAQQR